MNHYTARQRISDNRWDFTISNSRTGGGPVGYCAGPPELGAEKLSKLLGAEVVKKMIEDLAPYKDNFHTDGHATAEEAANCYKRYLLDTKLRIFDSSTQQNKCQVCKEWTSRYAQVGMYFLAPVCHAHANKEHISMLMSSSLDYWES